METLWTLIPHTRCFSSTRWQNMDCWRLNGSEVSGNPRCMMASGKVFSFQSLFISPRRTGKTDSHRFHWLVSTLSQASCSQGLTTPHVNAPTNAVPLISLIPPIVSLSIFSGRAKWFRCYTVQAPEPALRISLIKEIDKETINNDAMFWVLSWEYIYIFYVCAQWLKDSHLPNDSRQEKEVRKASAEMKTPRNAVQLREEQGCRDAS